MDKSKSTITALNTKINDLTTEKNKFKDSTKPSFGKYAGWIIAVVFMAVTGIKTWYTTKVKKKLAQAIDA